jgi:hypothetical protein
MSRQMRAALFHEFGSAEKIQISTIEIPELKEGEVLIKVKAAALNRRFSCKRRSLEFFHPGQFSRNTRMGCCRYSRRTGV